MISLWRLGPPPYSCAFSSFRDAIIPCRDRKDALPRALCAGSLRAVALVDATNGM